MTGQQRSAAGASCATCAAVYGISDSPVVEGLCAWGHVDPRALFAPLTKLETATLLEAIGAGAQLADDTLTAIVYGRSGYTGATDRTQIAELGAELGELRADLRTVFERKFFAAGSGAEEVPASWR